MTFSLVARCAQTGMFGVAISSSSPAVAARCAYARARVGAVASQNVTDPRLGPMMLDAISGGRSADEALKGLVETQAFMEYRQVLAIDHAGSLAIHSGPKALGIFGQAQGRDVASGGNLLANAEVPDAIVRGFETSEGHLADRLLAAMQSGLDAGGEAGPVHSAGMMIVDQTSWPIVDLRCDWTEDCPIAALHTAWQVYKPQIADYIQRALDPTKAPSYGVPGDE